MNEEKLNQIEALLEDESLLQKYIGTLESSNSEIPHGLNHRIINNINYSSQHKKKRSKGRMIGILKIVACTVFAIFIWSSILSSNISYATTKNVKRTEFYEKFDQIFQNVSDFFMKPIVLEGREKK